ncbi:hypothetical protein [Streptomyces uncialis]|uniref:DUF7848 domain-containing protein n=1 Tax=Streptomyces uncialis TaxID=1048205 RepID=UPI0033E7B3C1
MIRARYRHVRWTSTPNVTADAPPTLHLFRCTTKDGSGTPCGAESGESEEFDTAQVWKFRHLRDHQGHTEYEQVVRRAWHLVPDDSR